MDKLEMLKNLLDDESIKIEITEEEKTGDKLLKISSYYSDINKTIYINFYYLMELLKHYVAIDEILKTNEEIKELEDIPLF